jgi:pyruvate dehydrogenase (quinone)
VLNADRPVVINAYTDPDVPPLPPHITFEEAKDFMFAMLHDDPDRAGVIAQSIKQVVGDVLPHAHK